MFKVNNKNTRTSCEICSELTIKKYKKANQSLYIMLVIDVVKSLIIFRIWGPLKIPAFSFSSLSPVNALYEYLKQFSSLSKAFACCFIRPSLMCRSKDKILLLGTSGSLKMISPLICDVFLSGHIFCVQWLSLAQLFHTQGKHGYFV